MQNEAYSEVPEYHDPWQKYYQQLEAEQQHSHLDVNVDVEANVDVDYVEAQYHPAPMPTDGVNKTYTATETNSCIVVQEEPCELNYALMHNASIIEITNIQTEDTAAPASIDSAAAAMELTQTYAPQTLDTHKEECTCQAAINTRVDACINVTIATDIDDETHVNVAQEIGLAGALAQLRLGEQRTPEQEAYEQMMRRQAWEQGQVDYTGKDSFDNIWKRITETLESKPTTPPKEGAAASGSDTS